MHHLSRSVCLFPLHEPEFNSVDQDYFVHDMPSRFRAMQLLVKTNINNTEVHTDFTVKLCKVYFSHPHLVSLNLKGRCPHSFTSLYYFDASLSQYIFKI